MNQNKDLVKRIESTIDKDLELWNNYDLETDFTQSYTSLLDAISKNDSEMMSKICEKRLLGEW